MNALNMVHLMPWIAPGIAAASTATYTLTDLLWRMGVVSTGLPKDLFVKSVALKGLK